jgi:hypothetical protein
MSQEFIEFMRSGAFYDYDIEGIAQVFHDSDIEMFKKNYEENSDVEGVKIHKRDDPIRLRLGFVVDDGGSDVWHTVKLSAVKAYSPMYQGWEKE